MEGRVQWIMDGTTALTEATSLADGSSHAFQYSVRLQGLLVPGSSSFRPIVPRFSVDCEGRSADIDEGHRLSSFCVRDAMKASPIRTPFVLPISIAPKLPACVPRTPWAQDVLPYGYHGQQTTEKRRMYRALQNLLIASSTHPYTHAFLCRRISTLSRPPWPPILVRPSSTTTSPVVRSVSMAISQRCTIRPSCAGAGHFPESNARPTMSRTPSSSLERVSFRSVQILSSTHPEYVNRSGQEWPSWTGGP
ncbi:hypothetical protein C8F01DRAFT_1261831 [Mycena amicta]|nr:hypothetical protein C8F01DRAFT_1261831 [Mycena amicta]